MKSISLETGGLLKFNNALMLSNLAEISAELATINMADIVMLDLAKVTQIDSAGIALLLELQQNSKAQIELVNPPSSLETLLSLYNLTEMLPIAEETV